MLALFHSWLQSLEFLLPRNFLAFIKDSILILARALQHVISHFYLLVLFDCCWFMTFGTLIVKAYQSSHANPGSLGGGGLALLLISSVVWSVLGILTLLWLRRPAIVEDAKRYTTELFLRYIQLGFFLSLVVFVAFLLLVSLGIRNFPGVHWSFKVLIKMCQIIMLFYWLDSSFSFKDVFRSIESCVNLSFYRLPLFVFLFSLIVSVDMFFLKIFQSFLLPTAAHFFFTGIPFERFVAVPEGIADVAGALGIRYVSFISEFFFIALLYRFYTSQKDLVTAASFFDVAEEHNDDGNDEE